MFRAGQQFGFYTLIQQLGRGGFGEVWLAERRTKFLTTQVAVKLPLDEQVDHAAIEQEAQLWARASGHANVLPIIEANEYDGQILIASEYAVDGSLEGLLRRNGGLLPVQQAVEMTVGILKGLEFLHSRQIIHRDIKPANILLQGDTPRLADFGISRVLKTTSHATNVVGTPYFMAPEAFQRKRNAQTDVWSVGVLLYQMLKGELPFTGDNITDLFGAIMLSQPAPLPDSIPLNLQTVVGKALSKEVAGRYQTARAMRDELDECWRRLSPPTAAPVEEPVAVKKVDDQPTIISPVAPPDASKPRDEIESRPFSEIEKPAVVPDHRSELPPAPPKVQAKTRRLYFALPVLVVLLLAIIAAGYWLRHRAPGNMAVSNNTNTPLVPKAAPSDATDTVLIPFCKGDKFGFSDVNKKLVIEAKYDRVGQFQEGLALVTSHKKFGVVDKTGKEVIPPKYDYAASFSEGLAQVSLNLKWGYVDKTGQEVIPLKYDVVYSFSDGLAGVMLNGKEGFIDKTGQEVIPLKYDDILLFSNGLARVKLNGKYGFVDKTGKEVIPLKYTNATVFSKGLAAVNLNNKRGYIDKTGQTVLPFKYESASVFREGLAHVKLNNKWGYIDKTGKEVIPFKYEYADLFSEGLAQVSLNLKWGYVDKTGQEVIPLKYDSVSSFSEGLARVTLNDKRGFIDKTGQEIIPLKYNNVDSFSDGLAGVRLNGKDGFVDKTGQEVIPLKYDFVGSFSDGLAQVTLNGKSFYIDKNGTEYYEP